MDAVVEVLMKALPVLGGAAGTELAKRSVGVLWDRIKLAVQAHTGAGRAAPQLIEDLRASPVGSAAQASAVDSLAALGLEGDPQIVALARQLAEELAKLPPAVSVTQTAQKSFGATGHNAGTVNNHFNFSDKD